LSDACAQPTRIPSYINDVWLRTHRVSSELQRRTSARRDPERLVSNLPPELFPRLEGPSIDILLQSSQQDPDYAADEAFAGNSTSSTCANIMIKGSSINNRQASYNLLPHEVCRVDTDSDPSTGLVQRRTSGEVHDSPSGRILARSRGKFAVTFPNMKKAGRYYVIDFSLSSGSGKELSRSAAHNPQGKMRLRCSALAAAGHEHRLIVD